MGCVRAKEQGDRSEFKEESDEVADQFLIGVDRTAVDYKGETR